MFHPEKGRHFLREATDVWLRKNELDFLKHSNASQSQDRRGRMTRTFLLTMIFCALTIGCTARLGDFTVLSTQNCDLSQITPEQKKSDNWVEGENMKTFGIPNIEDAVDDALRKGNGNVMLDAVLYQKNGFFKSGFQVKGRVVEAR
jgi:hypothetical protein